MAISSSSIIDLAIPIHQADTPGIRDKVRDRLEWTWGLAHGHLDEHLREFVDPERILTDRTVLVFPHNDLIQEFSSRDISGRLGVRRPHIQKMYKGCTTFEYLIIPTDSTSTLPPRFLTCELPPHLALCTTYGKMMQTWGFLPRKVSDAQRESVVDRAKDANHEGRPALGMWQLNQMKYVYSTWSWIDYVPPSFLSEDSDHTMVEPEEEERPRDTKRKSAGSHSASRHEPKRRLLPSELQTPVTAEIRLFPSADGDAESDDDEPISVDSHISGVEGDPEEFAKASHARGDYEVDHKWLKKMRRWAADTSGADAGEALFNDEQIKDDSREQPRDAMSLDLAKPD
ncbi:hypothetical protein B0H14DRAFT_2692943, partial [Mycena olivaceomarginata]